MCNQFTLHIFRIDSGRTKFKQGKTDGFFTAVNPMHKNHRDPHEQFARRKGLKFNQTRCNAIIVHDTLPAYRISKVVVMESGEITYEKVYVSLRPPPTISFKNTWMKELDSEVAGSSKDTQRIQPKPKTQLSRTVRTVGGQEPTKEI